jgi:TonB family protein
MVQIRQVVASVLLAIAMVPQSSHAQERETALLREWTAEDSRYTRLQNLTKNAFPTAAGRDRRGRTFRDDIQNNVLTPEHDAKLATLRESFKAQLSAAQFDQAKVTLQTFTTAVEAEITNYQDITAYWTWVAAPPDRTPYLRYLRSNDIDPRNTDEIAALTQRFEQQIAAAQFGDAMGHAYPSLLALIERTSREEDAIVREAANRPGFKPFMERQRTESCPPLEQRNSGGPIPRLMQFGTGQDDFYPAASKRLNEQGKVYMLAHVSAEGCVERAIVTVSSGYPRLDAGGLDAMMVAHFLPAAQDGHAIAADYPFVMNFNLK